MSTTPPRAKRAAGYNRINNNTPAMRFIIPEQAVTHFHLRDGDRVGDFGAGSGFFEKALSRAVGASGRVFAFEIQKPLVERIAEISRTEHLSNIEVMWCDLEVAGGCKIADGTLDAGVMANALFQIEDKATALAEVKRVLRSGGKLFVLDWSESFGGMGPTPDAVLSEQAARDLLEAAGFVFERTFPVGEHHYGIAVRKP